MAQENSLVQSLKRGIFWNFGGLYFFYFAVWQLIFTFLPYWLKGPAGMDTTTSGLVFSIMSFGALILQPIFGPIQDRLGLKKGLFYFVILCILFLGPLFQWVFLPLVGANQILGAVVMGAYLSLCLNGGVGVVEAYNERSSRAYSFEYGHARLFGSLAGATASFVGGIMWAKNTGSIFWAMTFCAAVLFVLLTVVKLPDDHMAGEVRDEQGNAAKNEPITREEWLSIFKNRSFWGFCLLIIGSATMYDVFDQQFPNYFASFFSDATAGATFFSRVVSVQILLEAICMLFMPALINKIGAKTGLLIYGGILFVRVLGCAFINTIPMLVFWRLLAALEMPFMLVSVMKYITRVFDKRLSATVYMYGFGTAKQIGLTVFSLFMGNMYTALGFHHAYLLLAALIAVFVIVGSLLMRSDAKTEQIAR
ncbi:MULTISPECIES: oligosaccharide MFS transporter [Bifidobacterium]|uniref:oligosaccharide MFS transporter n=1 Tax=Bifidobacterium TaxID=1678 RepID=UPI0013D7047D|nr:MULTISPECIES: oligosaccharide MFS transporter [Bifidobacterium]